MLVYFHISLSYVIKTRHPYVGMVSDLCCDGLNNLG